MHDEQMKHTYVIVPIYKPLFFTSLSLLTRHYELYAFFSLKVFFKSAKLLILELNASVHIII